VKRVKKIFFVVPLVLFLTGIIAVSNFSVVSGAIAPGIYTDHQNACGEVLIDIAGHPLIVIDGFHYDYGDLGSGDVIRIWRYVDWPAPPNGPGPQWLPVAIFTDIPQRISLFQKVYAGYGTSIQLVNDPSVIETCREGNSKNVHVVWKTALEVPITYWGPPGVPKREVPAMTVPSGMLVFRGHGDSVSGYDPGVPNNHPSWSQSADWTGYFGDATFVCPTWNFGGPVGVDEGKYPTSIRLHAIIITTIN
jgi:hypothetical protein